MTNESPHRYKVLLVGDGTVGKTQFVRQHLSHDSFEDKYSATLGVEVHPIKFHTTAGTVVFNVWDCAGVKAFAGLSDGYYIKADAVIVMFDHTSQLSLKNVHKLQSKILAVVSDIPMVLCGNKSDLGLKNTPSIHDMVRLFHIGLSQ